MMSRERFEKSGWKMTYEQYNQIYCPDCGREGCPHRDAFRRVPEVDGGLGLCPNLHGARRITEGMAREFYRDLCGTVYGDANKTCGGTMDAELVADHMKITSEEAEEFLRAMCHFKITERQGGSYVI